MPVDSNDREFAIAFLELPPEHIQIRHDSVVNELRAGQIDDNFLGSLAINTPLERDPGTEDSRFIYRDRRRFALTVRDFQIGLEQRAYWRAVQDVLGEFK